MGAGVRSAMADRVMVMLPDDLRTKEVLNLLKEYGGSDRWWPVTMIKDEKVRAGVLGFLKSIDSGDISQEQTDQLMHQLDAADKAPPDWFTELDRDTWTRFTGGDRYYSRRVDGELQGTSTLEHIKDAISELLWAMNYTTPEKEQEEIAESAAFEAEVEAEMAKAKEAKEEG